MKVRATTEGRYISRSVDHLGFLGKQLRDLTGFASLTYELIQNADDAEDASWMRFDVGEAALVVDNDGIFSNCGDPGADECRSPGHLCDFHSFRRVASGDKRERQGTTGAFGVGFTAVYQITDRPELISADRHWILNEVAPEGQRIYECPECEQCRASDLPGTRFVLPWVFEPDSELRKRLRCAAVSQPDIDRLEREIREAVPTAMLFLKRLDRVELHRDGKLVRRFERVADGDDLLISDGHQNATWHVIYGDFHEEAKELRERHGLNIEAKRSSKVAVALPRDSSVEGLLCATLPTKQDTGFPFHVNADFYPSSDRKKIIMESDYQSEWNRAALRRAAAALAEALPEAPTWLGANRIWSMLLSMYHVRQEAEIGHREEAFGFFWDAVAESVPSAPIALTTNDLWLPPQQVVVLRDDDEEQAVPVLEALDIDVFQHSIRPFVLQFPRNILRIGQLDVWDLIRAMRSEGLTERVDLGSLPTPLDSHDGLTMLWEEAGRLLERAGTQQRPQAERALAGCAITLGSDGGVWPPELLHWADDETAAVFSPMAADVLLVATEGVPDLIARLSPEFSAETAVSLLESAIPRLHSEDGRTLLSCAKLLSWFEKRRDQVLASDELRERLVALPIYPSGGDARPLSDLFLPGNFRDPLDLAGLVDLAALHGRKEFLEDLGARELTFAAYARDFLPTAFTQLGLDRAQVRRVVELLANHVGELLDDVNAHDALAALPLVECTDGTFRSPQEAYFEAADLRDLLGEEIPFAAIPGGSAAAIHELFAWLGVASEPRPNDLEQRITALTSGAPNARSKQVIQRIVSYYGRRPKDDAGARRVVQQLRSIAWLPAKGRSDAWFEPNDLYLVFREYLFATQALFLDLPNNVQGAAAEFLRALGLNEEPDVEQVVEHLLECARTGATMNQEVYRFLDQNADHPAIDGLTTMPCILLSSGEWVHPARIFWEEPGLGRFRHLLGPEFRDYYNLLDRLGVRKAPDHHDAWEVLAEISAEFGQFNLPVDDEAHGVLLKCWRMLSDALPGGQLSAAELQSLCDRKVIPNGEGVLYPPVWIFFEDRAGLADKFRTHVGQNIVKRPEGAWPAMQAAGTRWLSEVVKSHLVECSHPMDDPGLAERIHSRRPQLLRVFEAHRDEEIDPARIDEIRMVRTSELTVQFSMVAFNRTLASDPEVAEALYRRGDEALYFVPRRDRYPWPGIARELTLALIPGHEPGPLASAVKDVLAAATPDEADEILDELGYRPLAVVDGRTEIGGAPLASLGGTVAEQLPETEASAESGGGDGSSGQFGVGDAIHSILGADVQEPTAMPPDMDSGDVGSTAAMRGARGSTGNTRARREQGHKGSQRGRLRTYVYPNGVAPGTTQSEEAVAKRDAVAQAGVDRVMQYEQQAGRFPKEMPPLNPGYDIESRDASGEILRYIEVKSLTDRWDSLGAGLTRPEFEESIQMGDKSWLYVVERAEQDDYRIYRIQDPARLVNQFMYDAGWGELAEDDPVNDA